MRALTLNENMNVNGGSMESVSVCFGISAAESLESCPIVFLSELMIGVCLGAIIVYAVTRA